VFGRSYAAEPDVLVEELKGDEAIAEAETLYKTNEAAQAQQADAASSGAGRASSSRSDSRSRVSWQFMAGTVPASP
jgi:hypothetical protein